MLWLYVCVLQEHNVSIFMDVVRSVMKRIDYMGLGYRAGRGDWPISAVWWRDKVSSLSVGKRLFQIIFSQPLAWNLPVETEENNEIYRTINRIIDQNLNVVHIEYKAARWIFWKPPTKVRFSNPLQRTENSQYSFQEGSEVKLHSTPTFSYTS